MYFLAKYNTQTTIYFAMVKHGVVDLAASADWTPATGDTKISKDGGNFANTTNNPVAVGGTGSVGWSITLTATELSAGVVNIQIVDSVTKAVEDQYLTIYTYGNAAGKIVVDWSDTVRMGLTALPNAAAEAAGGLFTRGAGAGQINQPANGRIDANVAAYGTGLQPTLPIRSSTAQAGSAANTIVLDAGASAVDNYYNGARVTITSGTGVGQHRIVGGYTGATKTAYVFPNWVTTPDATSVYELRPGFVDVTYIENDVITSGALNANAVTEIQSGLATSSAVATLQSDTDDIQTRLPAALVSGKIDANISAIAANAITAAAIADGAIDAATFAAGAINAAAVADGTIDAATMAADMNTYAAKVWLFDDNTGSTDRYVVVWHKNGQPITSGITSPTIQVFKVADGTDLVASATAMTQIGTTGTYRYNEGTNRIVNGVAYIIKVQATIDSATRTWYQPVGRDS